jgi:hypothetical protein
MGPKFTYLGDCNAAIAWFSKNNIITLFSFANWSNSGELQCEARLFKLEDQFQDFSWHRNHFKPTLKQICVYVYLLRTKVCNLPFSFTHFNMTTGGKNCLSTLQALTVIIRSPFSVSVTVWTVLIPVSAKISPNFLSLLNHTSLILFVVYLRGQFLIKLLLRFSNNCSHLYSSFPVLVQLTSLKIHINKSQFLSMKDLSQFYPVSSSSSLNLCER